MPLSDQQIRALLLATRETHADEIDCEQFLTFLAEYAEARAEGRTLPQALAKVEEHERLCPNCREECGALIELIRVGTAVEPPGHRRLEADLAGALALASGELARQHLPLGGVAGQQQGGAKQLGGTFPPAGARLELGHRGGEERVTLEPLAILDVRERPQSRLGPFGHAHRDGAVERHDGRGLEPKSRSYSSRMDVQSVSAKLPAAACRPAIAASRCQAVSTSPSAERSSRRSPSPISSRSQRRRSCSASRRRLPSSSTRDESLAARKQKSASSAWVSGVAAAGSRESNTPSRMAS